MPNHVVNELIFRGLTANQKRDLLAVCCNEKGEVDFERLLPSPLNIWPGNVSEKHEKAFPATHLDWAKKNWGTKWNAYAHRSPEIGDDYLILRFDTAWRPPYGWIIAIFNRFKLSFEHNWLSEGAIHGICGRFNYEAVEDWRRGEPWAEEPATGATQRHLHFLRWGVEEFDAPHPTPEP